MCKFSGKILMLAVSALLLNAGAALADPASTDWNNSWGFPTSFEKANLLNQALAIDLIENDGNSNQTNYYDNQSTSIGNQVIAIDNSINNSTLDSFNTKDSFNKTSNTTTTTNSTSNKNVNVDNSGPGH